LRPRRRSADGGRRVAVPDADRRQPDGDHHGARHPQRRPRHRSRPEVPVMTAVALAPAAAPAPGDAAPRALPPLPTAAALALERATRAELELVMVRGATPELDGLV